MPCSSSQFKSRGEQWCQNRQHEVRVSGQPSLCLPGRLSQRSSRLRRLKAGGLGRIEDGDGGRRGDTGGGGTRDTHLPFPVHSCPEIVPKGQCSNSCGFPAPRPKKQGAGAPVATLICSFTATWHPAPRSRALALPASLFWVRVAPWPR